MFFRVHSSKNIGDPWKKYLGEQLINLQLFLVWVLPILGWISIWFQEDVAYDVSIGNEDGRVCYPYKINEDGEELILFTHQQYVMLIVTDSLVFTTLIISSAIVFFRIKKQTAEVREKEKNNQAVIFVENIKAADKMRTLNMTMGWVIAAFVIFRLPFFIFASVEGMTVKDCFNWYFRVAVILYIARFSVMPIMFGKTNAKAKKAYSDVINALTPKCMEKTTLKRDCYNNFIGCCKR